MNALGDLLTDAFDFLQLLVACTLDRIDRTESPASAFAFCGPTMRIRRPNSTRASPRDFDPPICSSTFAIVFSPMRGSFASFFGIQRVDLADVVRRARDRPARTRARRRCLRCPSRRANTNAARARAAARDMSRSCSAPSLRLRDDRPANRTPDSRRHRVAAWIPFALAGHGPTTSRNHVAGAPHDHDVADADILAPDIVLVVQRRAADRDAADLHRLEHRIRIERARAADVDPDARAASSALRARET